MAAGLGFVSRTHCSGDCSAFDSVLRNGDARLLISQGGAALSGSVNRLEIMGTAAGSSTTVTGRHAVAIPQSLPSKRSPDVETADRYRTS
jgi:hypothetical protein